MVITDKFLRKSKKLKVLILSDGARWIVDRNTDQLIRGIPCDFTKVMYTKISSDEFVKLSNRHDLVHYMNWDLRYHLDVLEKIDVPFLLSIRSHRYPSYVKEVVKKITKVHVVNRLLLKEFPGAVYIPNGIFEQFYKSSKFIVGFSGKSDEYKGFHLIKQACKELGITFKPATGNLRPSQMVKYYKSIDLLVSASIAEGQGTPVLECLAMNIPVITTNVGAAYDLDIVKVKRNVEDIKRGILKYYTFPMVEKEFRWSSICEQFFHLYVNLVTDHRSKLKIKSK